MTRMRTKPTTSSAMIQLLDKAQVAFPFEMDEAQICAGECIGCPKKLLAYLEMELADWQGRMDDGHIPTLGSVDKLNRTCTKIHRVLQKNGLMD